MAPTSTGEGMTAKKTVYKPFTVQVRLVLIADVEVEADSLEDALALGKDWSSKDVVVMDAAASECDSSLKVVGAWSPSAWSVD